MHCSAQCLITQLLNALRSRGSWWTVGVNNAFTNTVALPEESLTVNINKLLFCLAAALYIRGYCGSVLSGWLTEWLSGKYSISREWWWWLKQHVRPRIQSQFQLSFCGGNIALGRSYGGNYPSKCSKRIVENSPVLVKCDQGINLFYLRLRCSPRANFLLQFTYLCCPGKVSMSKGSSKVMIVGSLHVIWKVLWRLIEYCVDSVEPTETKSACAPKE